MGLPKCQMLGKKKMEIHMQAQRTINIIHITQIFEHTMHSYHEVLCTKEM